MKPKVSWVKWWKCFSISNDLCDVLGRFGYMKECAIWFSIGKYSFALSWGK